MKNNYRIHMMQLWKGKVSDFEWSVRLIDDGIETVA